MLETAEFLLKISFFILSIIWIGRIMIVRTDKQIVINPLLILISALLVITPESDHNIEIFGVSVQMLRVILYSIYSIVVIFGIYVTNMKNGFF